MLKKIVYIFLFFTIIMVSCEKNKDAQDIIFNFYNQYLSSSIDETKRQELIKKYCSKNLLETLDILYSFDEEEGLIIGIDYDPFLNAQDVFSRKDIKIEKKKENKYKISFNDTNNTIVTLKIIKDNNNNWKIDSIDINNWEQIKKEVTDYWSKKGKSIPKIFSK